jgi:hypothetical protein
MSLVPLPVTLQTTSSVGASNIHMTREEAIEAEPHQV